MKKNLEKIAKAVKQLSAQTNMDISITATNTDEQVIVSVTFTPAEPKLHRVGF